MYVSKGFNVETLKYLPSGFKNYKYKELRLKDLSIGQVTSLSILSGEPNLQKLLDIYTDCFIDLSPEEVSEILYIDFITVAHFINHLSFGLYENTFTYKCDCGENHQMKYNLYDLEFTDVKKKYEGRFIKHGDLEVMLRPHTVGRMSDIVACDKDEDTTFFLASTVKDLVYKKVKAELPEDIEQRAIELGNYPQSLKDFVTRETLLRYPSVKPLTLMKPCGKPLTFLPDITYKGLPRTS